MGLYKDRRNYVDHNFNTTTITIDGDHKGEGLQMIEVELDEDEVDVQKVADGTGIFVEDPSQSGVIRVQFIEASVSNDKMWDLRESGAQFSVSILDTAAPSLNCGAAKMKIVKPPVVRRGRDHDTAVEWVMRAVYLDVKGGSYRLSAA